ncbi:MAG: hypothetical protein AAF658_15730 [Myxococcota bacterium]
MKKTLIGVALCAVAVGCGSSDEEAQPVPEADPWLGDLGGASYPLEIADIAVEGVLNRRAIVGALSGEAWHDPGFTTVMSRVEGGTDDGAFMTVVYFEGGLDHPSLRPGTTIVQDGVYDPDVADILIVGCQGLIGDDAYAYDVGAESASLRIGELTPDNRVSIDYEATFRLDEDTLESVSGAFTVSLPTSE